MELEKIQEKLKAIINESVTKKNEISKELSNARKELADIESNLHQALLDCDIKKHNDLSAKKKDVEEKICFYADYLNNYNNAPLISNDVARDLLNDIDKCINEHLNKDYEEFCASLNNLYSIADSKYKYYQGGKDLAEQITNYAKVTLDLPDYRKIFIFRDVEDSLNTIKHHRNI